MTNLVERLERMLREQWLPLQLRSPASGCFSPGTHETCSALMRRPNELGALYHFLAYHLRALGVLRLVRGRAEWDPWRAIRAALRGHDARVSFYVDEWHDVAAEQARLGARPPNRRSEFAELRLPPAQLLENLTPDEGLAFVERLGHRPPVADGRYAMFRDFCAWFERARADQTLVAPLESDVFLRENVRRQREELIELAARLRELQTVCRAAAAACDAARAAATAELDGRLARAVQLARASGLLPFRALAAETEDLAALFPESWRRCLPPPPDGDDDRPRVLAALTRLRVATRALDVDSAIARYAERARAVSLYRATRRWNDEQAALAAGAEPLPLLPAPAVPAAPAFDDALLAVDRLAALEQLLREVAVRGAQVTGAQMREAMARERALPTTSMELRLQRVREEAAAQAARDLEDAHRTAWLAQLRERVARDQQVHRAAVDSLQTAYQANMAVRRDQWRLEPRAETVDNEWFVELFANTQRGMTRTFAQVRAMPALVHVHDYTQDLRGVVWAETA